MPDHQPATPADDWTVTVADQIESVVGAVRDRTTVPIVTIARIVVYGLLAAVAGVTLLVLLVIAVLRLNVWIPVHPVGRKVWIADAAVSVVFLLVGSVLWKKRGSPQR